MRGEVRNHSRLVLVATWLIASWAQAEPDAGSGRAAPVALSPSQVARAFTSANTDKGDTQEQNPRGTDSVKDAYARLLTKGEIELERKSDRSYVYQGRGINARIDAQGGFVMTDKFSRSKFVFKPTPIDAEGVNWVTNFFQTTFDLLRRVEKAFGNDLYRSERREFLEQTEELRIALMERHQAAALGGLMHSIWSATGVSIAEKRIQLFHAWCECSDDAFGDTGRVRIEQFIAERCPKESACAFTAEELERLNREAAKKNRRFDPYRSR